MTYAEGDPAVNHAGEIAAALKAFVERPLTEAVQWPTDELDRFSARSLSGELARVLDLVAGAEDAHQPRQ